MRCADNAAGNVRESGTETESVLPRYYAQMYAELRGIFLVLRTYTAHSITLAVLAATAFLGILRLSLEHCRKLATTHTRIPRNTKGEARQSRPVSLEHKTGSGRLHATPQQVSRTGH